MKKTIENLLEIIKFIIYEMIDNWQFKNAYYYYNPRMEKGTGKNAMYVIDVYKYGRTKKKPVIAYADRNPKKLMKKVRSYVDIMNCMTNQIS